MDTSSLLVAAALMSITAVSAEAAPQRIVLPKDVVPTHYTISVTPDAANMTFTGSVEIDLEVKQATQTIELNAADLAFSKVALSGVDEAPAVKFDPSQETATLSFKAPVPAGHHVLHIDYSGKINRHPAGLFALDYNTANGTRRALFTQFENSDARRFIPCWDEPGIKSTFSLTVTVPANEMALSNMPIAKSEPLAGGLAKVTFAETPKMSSYLLFFGDGDFDRIHRKVNGVDVGIVVQKGAADQAEYALDVASQILPYYEDYFGVKYPLPKLDLIGGPGQSQFFGAMENWGAIFYFERDLIIDPRISTEDDRRRVYVVIAHEMAHQWFGDLVTMAWWDDLWLNEGFASWMEVKATAHFHPEWQMWLDSIDAKEHAMAEDGRGGTHPIITPIYDVLQASQAFDGITYDKGQAVIRMLEDYVGADAFRDGVRAYIKAHEYGNTVTDDLWRELDKTSHQNISAVAHDFTLQAGIPLIRVGATTHGLHLSQDRYTADGKGTPKENWRVPVIVASVAGKPIWHGLVSSRNPADVAVPPDQVPVVNAGQAGYFRALYDAASFARLTSHFSVLQPTDQLGLLNDSLALGYAGNEPLGDYMELTTQITANVDPKVLDEFVGQLEKMNFYYEDLPSQPGFKSYARRVLEPVFAKVGWDAKPGEDSNITVLRVDLLEALGEFDDAAVVSEAQGRFAAYLKNPSSLSAELRRSVLGIVADHADAATWEKLHGLAKAAGSNMEKRELYGYLASAHDRKLAQQALDLSLTDEVPATTRPAMLAATSRYYPDLALSFYVAHQSAYEPLLEPASRARFAPRIAMFSRDTAILKTLHDYAAEHIPESARGDVVKADAAVNETATIRGQRLPDVDNWLKSHGG